MFKENEFKDKLFVITGATGYLGREITDQVNQSGGSVLMVDRDQLVLDDYCKELRSKYPLIQNFYYSCDFEDDSKRQELVSYVFSSTDKVDCLINNAAFVGTSDLNGWSVNFEKQEIDTWRRAIEVNLNATFFLCQKLAPLIKKSLTGNIINIASIYGFLGPDWDLYSGTNMSNPAAYGASKAGVIQFTKWLASTLGPIIRVNCVSPGGIFRKQDSNFVEAYIKKTPLKKMGTEKEIAHAVIFLASKFSSYMTGHNLVVDGGYSIC